MKEWEREVRDSLYLHRPLPLHREREYEARFARKKVLSAVAAADAKVFSLLEAESGEEVFLAPVETVTNERGTFQVLDFSPFTTPGEYVLQAGELQSSPFEIGENLMEESLWKVLNFFFCQRCGFPVPGKHGTCHQELTQIAREQLYWMWGKNPFGQCLVYGAGRDFCRQYTVHMGDTVGSVPVGIESRDNEDVPYWPQNNNATFRELWIGAVCRFLQVCAECGEQGGGQ